MSSRYLFDSHALLTILKVGRIDVLINQHVSEVAILEVATKIFQDYYLKGKLNLDEVAKVAKFLEKILEYMNVLSIRNYVTQIVEFSCKHNIDPTQALNIVLANVHNLTLITGSDDYYKLASRFVSVKHVQEII